MQVRFLLDENLHPGLKQAVKQKDPNIDVLRVGDKDAPPFSTQDPDLIAWCSQERRLLVTNDRKTMPGHLNAYRGAGRHHWGVLWVRPNASIGELASNLYLVWMASKADDWRDQEGWIPF